MQKIIEFLEPLIQHNIKRPYWVLFIALITAVAGGYVASNLTVDTDFANLLPPSNPSVQALEKLRQTAGGETSMKVAIKSPSFEANVEFANKLAEESLKLHYERYNGPFFTDTEFRRETEFLKNNTLYLATTAELDSIIQYLQDEIDQAKEEANPFLVDFDDFDDEEEADEEEDLDQFKESYNMLVPSEYPINEDSTLAILTLYPSGSRSDITYLEDMFSELRNLIDRLEPSSYHPEMEVRFGGRIKRHLTELESIMNDVYNSFATGISSVILLVILYFSIKKYLNYRRTDPRLQKHSLLQHIIRAPVPMLIIGIPLLVSLMWTFGITSLYLGTLNTMTSVLFVILFGLGIDYGIHYYARYIELRAEGNNVEDSVLLSYMRTGTAIVVSALTTASALFILMFADFRGFSEFGFIAGIGIMFALFCMLFVLPSLLVLFERWNWLLLPPRSEDRAVKPIFKRFPMARSIIVFSVVTAVTVIAFSGNLEFEYDFGKLEPEFPEYREFQEFTSGVDENEYHNPAFVIVDTYEEVFEVVDTLRARMEADPNTMIEEVEAIQERFPPFEEMKEQKLQKISRIRELLQDPFIENQEGENIDILRQSSQTREPLTEEQIPDFLKNRFITNEGEIGRFVIVYPKSGLSNGLRSIRFKEDVSNIQLSNGKTYHAGSTSIVAATMLDLMRTESPYMVIATFIVVFICIALSFQSMRWTLIALIPLVIGLLWLFGIQLLFGLKFNFYNLVVLPAILGIGCDNGVHLAHRYRAEGRKSMWEVLSSTGQHITIGSLTTMLGFAGLLFTNHPGLQSIGIMAVVGIGMTLLSALTFLPSMVQFLEDKHLLNKPDEDNDN
ncbi:efflux RND transporter permease subunit [Rhodohalobacter sp. 8-1]|uniref:efflux RND transporter permease subunit n=1 Tax=Rhodohalobacter sp. 8-1 TaxID=3131972 RepID=UPI0030EC7803